MKKTLMVFAVFSVALLTGFPVMASDAGPAAEAELRVETAEVVDLGFLAEEQASWLGLATSTNLSQCPAWRQPCLFNEQCDPGCLCEAFCCGGD
ncbi:MAG: hypothetical protein K0U98_02970 [Deltaproteobacteria bacterium]|nr:hypothetical protein [Deltaproteobacteria bacterium]